MPAHYDFAVSLRVKHPSTAPSRIAFELGMEPAHAWVAGEPRRTPKGTPLEGVYPDNYCSFALPQADGAELTGHLHGVLARLSPHADFLRDLRASGGDISFYVLWRPSADTGAVLDTKLMSGMSDLGIDFGLNVYDDRTR